MGTSKQFNQGIIIMRMYIKCNKLVIITESQTFYFVLPKDADNNLKHEVDFIIQFLAEHTTKKQD